MDRELTHMKTEQSMKVVGRMAKSMVKAFSQIKKENLREAFGTMEKEKDGSIRIRRVN